jgi:hypothetical protein
LSPDAEQIFRHPASAEQVSEFQEWEKQNAAAMFLRYADFPATSAFGVRSSDVVTVNDEIKLSFAGSEAQLFDTNGRHIGKIVGIPIDLLQAFLASLDGERDLIRVLAVEPFGRHRGSLEALVNGLLGGLFLVPAAIETLENKISAIELLRFPSQSPYAMPRQYWENSFAVRNALDVFYGGLETFEEFSAGLRGLHRLATLGANGRTYYGGAGGIATVPGEYRNTLIGNRFDERKKWILSTWTQLLGCNRTLLDSGTVVSVNDVPLLEIINDGAECRHLYGRRGEYLALQINEIRSQLAGIRGALKTNDADKALRHCALFHHAFAHAHPFNNINNSIAMNIVNDLLRKAGIGVLPHLYFDQLAYFVQPNDYVEFFEIAVRAHVMNQELGHNRPMTGRLLKAIVDNPS